MAKKKKDRADLPTELIDVKTVRITSLEADNVLRVRAVRLKFDDSGVLVIEGANEAGKSSVLKIIEMAIAGAATAPAEPIHGNEEEGKIIARFATEVGELVVTKMFIKGKPQRLYVHIEGRRKALSSAQTILDILMDHIALDIRQFARMDDKKKAEVLAQLMGFDSAALDAERGKKFDLRTEVNRDVVRLRAEYESLTHHDDAPNEEVSAAELMSELDDRRQHNESGTKLNTALTAASEDLQKALTEVGLLEKSLTDARLEAEEATEKKKKAVEAVAGFQPDDEEEIRQKVTKADAINDQVRENAKKKEARAAYLEKQNESDELTAGLGALDLLKKKSLAEAQERLPVKGLGISNGAVTYKGKPFSQAGSSATAVTSAAISMALNEDSLLKLVQIDDAENMDAKTTEKVVQMCVAKGFQIVMARVGKGELPTVVIEDGAMLA